MKKKSLLFSSVAMLLVSVIALAGTTYAWFTGMKEPKVARLNASVVSADTLLISAKSTEGFKSTITRTDFETARDPKLVLDDYNWGGSADEDKTFGKNVTTSTPTTTTMTSKVFAYDNSTNFPIFTNSMVSGFAYEWHSGTKTYNPLASGAGTTPITNYDIALKAWLINTTDAPYTTITNDVLAQTFIDDGGDPLVTAMAAFDAEFKAAFTYGPALNIKDFHGASTAQQSTLQDKIPYLLLPVFFRASAPLDVYLNIDTLLDNFSKTYFTSQNAVGGFDHKGYRQELEKSLRVGYISGNANEITVADPTAYDTTVLGASFKSDFTNPNNEGYSQGFKVYAPHEGTYKYIGNNPDNGIDPASKYKPATITGDVFNGSFGVGATLKSDTAAAGQGQHIVTDLYTYTTHEDIVGKDDVIVGDAAHPNNKDIDTATDGNQFGIKLGRLPMYNNTTETVLAVYFYIWIEGNDLDNTAAVAGGNFASSLAFLGVEVQ